MTTALILFTISIMGFTWPFIWYPLLLRVLPRISLKYRPNDMVFGITVIIPCFNEAANIQKKLENVINVVGPRPVQIIVADDGSTDECAAVAESFAYNHPCIKVHRLPRQGKGRAINSVWNSSRYDIVIITDANAVLNKNSISALLDPFSNTKVGATRGRYVPQEQQAQDAHQGASGYQDFNHRVFTTESQRGLLHVSGGALQAFRRSLHNPDLMLTMSEDWDMTLEVRRAGWLVIYTPEAIAYKRVTVRNDELWRQQVRLVYGTIQTTWKYRKLLNPFKYYALSISFISGKLAQIIGPWWIMLGTVSGLLMIQRTMLLYYSIIVLSLLLVFFIIINWHKVRLRIPLMKQLEYISLIEAATAWAWILYVIRGGRNWKGWIPLQSVRL